jgi:transcriptional regulator with XRE-family HTH domain
MLWSMDDVKLGRRFRVLRHRLGWRQSDVGVKASISQDTVSRVETGKISDVSISALRRHAAALGAELRIEINFRGGELDRLVDAGHAALVGAVVQRLQELGWEVRPEVSFSVYGERGSIDVVGWHEASRTLLVIEVKTELTSIEETLRRHDAKVRLAADVVRKRFGWHPLRVARLLVLPDTTTARSQVKRHDAVLRTALPVRGQELREWMRSPAGVVEAIAFVPPTQGSRAQAKAAGRQRVRPPRDSGGEQVPGTRAARESATDAADASSVHGPPSARGEHASSA